ncbi:RelA/SpoT domain-containing protein [Pseudoalteromonas sp. SG45-2]|uniref:RelA/SpoT domain-containing protein n=1 Tax=Pseudoalteromonas sp. SG45-2 TaxID=2760956 RepID=UPI001601033A|nr:RelA/SpoT domain-containing protein [Pseudoalteromonas sp. SG45-2]MBB1346515.1 RelA/SpoT domain-containing protein [Pseudoalteromonas sp. SG45-2]
MNDNYEQVLLKKLHVRVEAELSRLGLLFRVFSRSKTEQSITSKINKKGDGYYSPQGKKIQDLYGLRVALYFPDDLKIAQRALEKSFKLISKEVDSPNTSLFEATRCNYIFKLPLDISSDSSILNCNSLVDDTFEVQFRTVLSEGWHEVEHDLRYKCKDDWGKHDDLSRALNGVFASLETSEWAMMRLFEDLTYRHYKSSEWAPMIRNKFRLRAGNELNSDIEKAINENNLGKAIYRLNRVKIILTILNKNINIPININTLVYIANYYFLKNEKLTEITPRALVDILSKS